MRIGLRLVLLLCVTASGCATVTSGTTDTIRIESVPPDATVTLAGQSYRTPVTLTLSRTRSYDVIVQKDGFLEARRVISRVGNSISTANLLVGGVVGIMTDQSSGAAFRLYPTELNVDLVSTTTSERVYKRNEQGTTANHGSQPTPKEGAAEP